MLGKVLQHHVLESCKSDIHFILHSQNVEHRCQQQQRPSSYYSSAFTSPRNHRLGVMCILVHPAGLPLELSVGAERVHVHWFFRSLLKLGDPLGLYTHLRHSKTASTGSRTHPAVTALHFSDEYVGFGFLVFRFLLFVFRTLLFGTVHTWLVGGGCFVAVVVQSERPLSSLSSLLPCVSRHLSLSVSVPTAFVQTSSQAYSSSLPRLMIATNLR